MTGVDLASHVSGKIARTNPLEGGPEMEAWRNGSAVMADTWGGYVSRLGELLGPEVGLPELLGKLCIDREALADPKVQFAGPGQAGFNTYRGIVRNRVYEEVKDYFKPELVRLHTIIDAIMEGYRVPDENQANEQAEELQLQIQAVSAEEMRSLAPDERAALSMKQTALCMHRDALGTGVVIPAAEFVSIMLSANVVASEDAPSELAENWVAAVKYTLENFIDEFSYDKHIPAEQCVLGRDAFVEMKAHLLDLSDQMMRAENERWDKIRPVFYARPISEHPLVTGINEK